VSIAAATGGLEDSVLKGLLGARSTRSCGGYACRAKAADERKLDGRIERIDAEGQAEEIDFEAFDAARGNAGQAEE
jgi:hypothetical protein